MSKLPSTAPALLDAALQTLAKRGTDYDQPQGERSMVHCVQVFNAITGQQMSERDGWIFMVALKLARALKGAPKPDTYLDGAAYFALLGECALASNKGPGTGPPCTRCSGSGLEPNTYFNGVSQNCQACGGSGIRSAP